MYIYIYIHIYIYIYVYTHTYPKVGPATLGIMAFRLIAASATPRPLGLDLQLRLPMHNVCVSLAPNGPNLLAVLMCFNSYHGVW